MAVAWQFIESSERWNRNLHHHPVVLAEVGPDTRRAIDVGCGVGTLLADLVDVVPDLTGIDLHEPSVAVARAELPPSVELVVGDLLTYPLESASFDLVASVATVHHLDLETALERLADLVAPGGVLVVVGLARTRSPVDLALDVAARIVTPFVRRGRTRWDPDTPKVWPPPTSYGDVRRIAGRVLPGARYRRHLQFRYSLVWRRPGASVDSAP